MTTRKTGTVDGGRCTVNGEQPPVKSGQHAAPGHRFLLPCLAPWFPCSFRALTFVLLLAALSAPPLAAQNSQYNAGVFQRGQLSDGNSPLAGDTGNRGMEAKRLEAMNAERQKALVSDTNKLVKLTAELNAQINGTHPSGLTADQLRMVAEIEKLAHSIREKMCTPVKGLPPFGIPGPGIIPPPLQ